MGKQHCSRKQPTGICLQIFAFQLLDLEIGRQRSTLGETSLGKLHAVKTALRCKVKKIALDENSLTAEN